MSESGAAAPYTEGAGTQAPVGIQGTSGPPHLVREHVPFESMGNDLPPSPTHLKSQVPT